jgi:N-acetylneuraminic acid mutarotase
VIKIFADLHTEENALYVSEFAVSNSVVLVLAIAVACAFVGVQAVVSPFVFSSVQSSSTPTLNRQYGSLAYYQPHLNQSHVTVLGGTQNPPGPKDTNDEDFYGAVWRYNTSTNTWAQLSLNWDQYNHCSDQTNDIAYVYGGEFTNVSGFFMALNLSLENPTQFSANFAGVSTTSEVYTAHPACSLVNNYFYVFGGRQRNVQGNFTSMLRRINTQNVSSTAEEVKTTGEEPPPPQGN